MGKLNKNQLHETEGNKRVLIIMNIFWILGRDSEKMRQVNYAVTDTKIWSGLA